MGDLIRFPKRKSALDANTDELERLAIEHHKAYEALRKVNREIAETRLERCRLVEAERERASKAKG